MLPLSTDEADQTGKPDETRDDKEMAGIHKDLRDRSHPGGGPSKILDIFGRLSGRREFVTASTNSIGGAVTRLSALIPDPDRPGDPPRPAK